MRRFPVLPRQWQPYLAAVLLVGAVSAVSAAFMQQVAPTNLVMLYLLAVVVAGLRWGQGAAVLASVLGVLAFDFFFVPPYFTFEVADAEYFITFAALLAVAMVIGTLTGQLRDHAAALRRREQETAALYAFARAVVAAPDLPAVTQALVNHVSEILGQPAAVILPEPGQPVPDAAGPGFIPLRTSQGIVGALATQHPMAPASDSSMRLVEAFAAQAAVVIERFHLAEVARRARLLEEGEKLHDALLHSISHALRTPLASIIGSLSALTDPGNPSPDCEIRKDLLKTAREEAERLNWLVGNLLDMTRLESGYLKLNRDWHDLEDVIGVALDQTADILKGRPVHVGLPDQLPLVPLDHILVVQVLDNLLANAAKYSPPGSPIEIEVCREGEAVAVQVADRGPGIPAGDLERVFEKFYRVEQPGNPAGTGLGLAICKGIVEAHRGHIWAEPRAGGGTMIRFSLPLSQVPGSEGAYELRPE